MKSIIGVFLVLAALTVCSDLGHAQNQKNGDKKPPIDPKQKDNPYKWWLLHHRMQRPYPVPVYSGNTIINNIYQPASESGYDPYKSSTAVLPKPSETQAVVSVILPTTAAVVWVDGEKKDSGLSAIRVYTTPDLEPGHTYQYRIKAQWVQRGENVNEERTVAVKPGSTTVVDFTKKAKY
ncbi:MAG: TIGR03000 domain-containing protein [Gemmataceae bacterium]|nr:TIGR03000 domain-containing protein [Gemmataceae bacterium]MCI0740279.1 TIGR03000 domain-containing protein [Gemmataceae bacterium]